ncbi:Isochorismatase-like protein [Pelagophyceae sp. CCMP2097]|nr:Isochorismatase-like protein [Pelagophyceae sp. CCMP2097]
MASVVRSLGRLKVEGTVLLVCDIQERFRDVIHGFDSLVGTTKFLVQAAAELGIPVVVTEQYPKAFKATVAEVSSLLPDSARTFEKTVFSMCTPEFRAHLGALGCTSAIVCGLETHVCVLQTTLDLLEGGVDVHVCADAVSSQREFDRSAALARLGRVAHVSTAESLVFQLLGDSRHPSFKALAPAVKAHADHAATSALQRF